MFGNYDVLYMSNTSSSLLTIKALTIIDMQDGRDTSILTCTVTTLQYRISILTRHTILGYKLRGMTLPSFNVRVV